MPFREVELTPAALDLTFHDRGLTDVRVECTRGALVLTLHRESLAIAQQQAGPLLERLRKLIEVDLANVEKQMNALGAPWTPGRIPQMLR